MAEDGAHIAEQQHRHQPSAPERLPQGQEQVTPPPVPSYSFSLLGDPRLNGRGNGPVRAAVVQRMQRTAGNRATIRWIQRMTTGRPLVAVQRLGDDDDEQANQPQGRGRSHQPSDQADNQANNQAVEEEDIWANLGDNGKANKQADNADDEANLPQGPVATLLLKVDVRNADDLGVTNVALGQVGHTWIGLDWDEDVMPTPPKSITNPTRSQLIAQGNTSMGFYPLAYDAADWTDTAQEERKEEHKAWPEASPGGGKSSNVHHEGYSLLPKKKVPGRVEQPDLSHVPKAYFKYPLTLAQVENLVAYVDLKRRADYSLAGFNCTTFALEAVESAGQDAPSGVGKMGYTYPNALYTNLVKLLKGNKKNGYDQSKGYLKAL